VCSLNPFPSSQLLVALSDSLSINRYGFRKIAKGPEIGAYTHDSFLRDAPDQLGQVRRLPQGHSHHKPIVKASGPKKFVISRSRRSDEENVAIPLSYDINTDEDSEDSSSPSEDEDLDLDLDHFSTVTATAREVETAEVIPFDRSFLDFTGDDQQLVDSVFLDSDSGDDAVGDCLTSFFGAATGPSVAQDSDDRAIESTPTSDVVCQQPTISDRDIATLIGAFKPLALAVATPVPKLKVVLSEPGSVSLLGPKKEDMSLPHVLSSPKRLDVNDRSSSDILFAEAFGWERSLSEYIDVRKPGAQSSYTSSQSDLSLSPSNFLLARLSSDEWNSSLGLTEPAQFTSDSLDTMFSPPPARIEMER
jgi:hypothetical protein